MTFEANKLTQCYLKIELPESGTFNAAYFVTFDVLILEIKFLFFKNTVKYSNSGKHFTIFINFNKFYLSKQQHYVKIQLSRIIEGT